jgi:HlyD family secretion protein
MTATVTFHTASATDVLTVPNAALRFRPAGAAAEGTVQGRVSSAGASLGQGRANGARRNAASSSDSDPTASNSRLRPDATLWRVAASGKLVAVPVHAGLSDGQKTEVQGAGLTEGMQVIVGSNTGGSDAAAVSSTRNPLQGQQQGGRPRPPGVF